MKIVVGLGNPGPKYETTRHNAGFLAIDTLIEDWRASGPTTQNQGEIYQATLEGEKILLIKPQTFMNLSGKTVGPAFQFYKCAPEDLLVIHDDLDIAPGTFRLKTGGGHGGHNGLKSVDAAVGSAAQGYHRLRIGIGRPAPGSPINPVDYVLQQFSNSEINGLENLFPKIEEAARLFVRGQISSAMNKFNTKEKPNGL